MPSPSSATFSRPGKSGTDATLRGQSASRVIRLVLQTLPPDDLESLSIQVKHAFDTSVLSEAPIEPAPEDPLISDLTDGREYRLQERVELEMAAVARAFRLRQELLADSFTAPEIAKLLKTSRQTPHDRVKNGTLLGVLDRGVVRFPSWQLDPEAPDSIIEGLADVIRALRVSPLAKISWLVRPNPILDGRKPYEVLKQGETERVLRLAKSVGVD